MLKTKIAVLLMTSFIGTGGLLVSGSWASSHHHEEGHQKAAAQVAIHHEEAGEQPVAGNSICPVTSEKLEDGERLTVMHDGKPVNLCCQYCVNEFEKNPEKYHL